ncbi:MAG TPA: hypothetical protein VFA18_01880 [Gemmataceae bacterium]|nr:hypothetical protein [Gemmataceae bacterium]
MLAFSDPQIIRMAREDFIPVVGDDWYERRRQDAEGEFFRRVSDAAGRGNHDADGGPTRQSIYCLTASGKLLYAKNAGQLPSEMRKALRWGLEAWNKLPEAERRPGAIHVPELKPDPAFDRSLPSGGLILKTYTRALRRTAKGSLEPADVRMGGVRVSPQIDHVWITEPEWRALVPAEPKVGQRLPVPATLTQRLCRYHLVDSTIGEPVFWTAKQVRSARFNLVVEQVTPTGVRLRLEGTALLTTHPQIRYADRGYDVRLLGHLDYDREHRTFGRFDVVALGDSWGKNPIYNRGPKERTPLGVVFELSDGQTPADRVPPQGIRDRDDYLPRRALKSPE